VSRCRLFCFTSIPIGQEALVSEGKYKGRQSMVDFFSRIVFNSKDDRMSDDAIKVLDKFNEEVLEDIALSSEYELACALYGKRGGPFGEYSKIQKLMARVSAHLDARGPPQNTLVARREYYLACLRYIQVGIKAGKLEPEMSKDYLGGNRARNVIALFDVLCWRRTLCSHLLASFGASWKDDLHRLLLDPKSEAESYEEGQDLTWIAKYPQSVQTMIDIVHAIQVGDKDAALRGVAKNANDKPMDDVMAYGSLSE
jgi:hypothetical protein